MAEKYMYPNVNQLIVNVKKLITNRVLLAILAIGYLTACSMNTLLGKPEIIQSKGNKDEFKVNYVCTDPNSLLLGDMFNARENIEKACKKDEDAAMNEALKFCSSKKLRFHQLNHEVIEIKQYSYNTCYVCQPTDLHHEITFICEKNESTDDANKKPD